MLAAATLLASKELVCAGGGGGEGGGLLREKRMHSGHGNDCEIEGEPENRAEPSSHRGHRIAMGSLGCGVERPSDAILLNIWNYMHGLTLRKRSKEGVWEYSCITF